MNIADLEQDADWAQDMARMAVTSAKLKKYDLIMRLC
jgi:hypothetical protein